MSARPASERFQYTRIECECGSVWEFQLGAELRPPMCPVCKRVGDREMSLQYPVGILGSPALIEFI